MKKGLGKGLGALLSVFEDEDENILEETNVTQETKKKTAPVKNQNATKTQITTTEVKEGVIELNIIDVTPNPNQPRKQFSESALKELADSIKIHGVIQPIVVNTTEDAGKYLIIAGERRWRASKLAGKTTIPAIIKNYTPKQITEISIIENLQREDLNPIEVARAIKRLIDEYGFSQETVADRIGKSRSAVANTLRLLNLYPEVIKMVENGELSQGHAKCLVVIDDINVQLKFANASKNNKISVRDLERMVKEYLNPKPKKEIKQSIELKELVNEMSRVFSTKVSVLGNDSKGRIYIDYYNKDDLDRIAELLELLKQKTLTLKDLSNFNKKLK